MCLYFTLCFLGDFVMKLNFNWKVVALGVLSSSMIFASQSELSGVGTVAAQVQSQFNAITLMLTAAAYLIGLGFLVSGIFKLKAHKDNPQQNPMGTAVMHLTTGALLVYLPNLVTTAGGTFFATGTTAGTTGSTSLG